MFFVLCIGSTGCGWLGAEKGLAPTPSQVGTGHGSYYQHRGRADLYSFTLTCPLWSQSDLPDRSMNSSLFSLAPI